MRLDVTELGARLASAFIVVAFLAACGARTELEEPFAISSDGGGRGEKVSDALAPVDAREGDDRSSQDATAGVLAVSVGESGQVCALLSGGRVTCWGNNASGQLGQGTNTGPDTCDETPCSTDPVFVEGQISAMALSAGYATVCSVPIGGTVQCWGDNSSAQLGTGSNEGPDVCGTLPCSTTPVTVEGVPGAISVSVGVDSACALLNGGTAQCWGTNAVGELGDGTDTAPDTCLGSPCSPTPITVLGLTDAIAISVGGDSACALRSGGTVQCWGDNTFGELGTGTRSGPYGCDGSTCPKTPVTVAGLTDAIAISVGTSAACAVLSGGTVRCWGVNDSGQLGDGTHTNSSLPVEVEALTGATAISFGDDSVCAVLASGTVQCWGDNSYGQLGNGTTTDSPVPVSVRGLSDATSVSMSGGPVCAVLSSGILECWGDNVVGELGPAWIGGPQTCKFGPCSTTPVPVEP